jgi:hypothetical protein
VALAGLKVTRFRWLRCSLLVAMASIRKADRWLTITRILGQACGEVGRAGVGIEPGGWAGRKIGLTDSAFWNTLRHRLGIGEVWSASRRRSSSTVWACALDR